MKLSCAAILLGALIGLSAQAKDLYVNSSTGNDSVSYADNNESRPWRTLGRAVWGSTSISSPNTSQAARAGDTVIVAAGTYDTSAATGNRYTPIYNPVNRGTAGSPITFRAQTAGAVTLQSISSSNSQPIIGALNNAHIVWDGFVIDERNVPTRADTGPVVVWSSQHVTLQNLTIRGYNRNWADNHNGIRLENVADITVRNNLISGYVESHNNHNANALTIYNGTRVLIENNEVHSANAGIHVKCCSPGPVTIRYNLVRDVGKAYLFSGVQQAVMYSNIAINVQSGPTTNIYSETNGVENVTFANNTVINATGEGSGGILIRDGMELHRSIRSYNNVVSRARSCVTTYEPSITPALTSGYNAYHECSSRFAEIGGAAFTWQQWTALGKDTQGSRVISSPGFVNEAGGDYRPAAGSPLLGTGLDILDLNGNGSTTDRVNIGAYALGNEVIGRRPVGTVPNPPTNVRAQ